MRAEIKISGVLLVQIPQRGMHGHSVLWEPGPERDKIVEQMLKGLSEQLEKKPACIDDLDRRSCIFTWEPSFFKSLTSNPIRGWIRDNFINEEEARDRTAGWGVDAGLLLYIRYTRENRESITLHDYTSRSFRGKSPPVRFSRPIALKVLLPKPVELQIVENKTQEGCRQ